MSRLVIRYDVTPMGRQVLPPVISPQYRSWRVSSEVRGAERVDKAEADEILAGYSSPYWTISALEVPNEELTYEV